MYKILRTNSKNHCKAKASQFFRVQGHYAQKRFDGRTEKECKEGFPK